MGFLTRGKQTLMGKRLASIKVLSNEFNKVSNEFAAIEINLKQIAHLSVEEINGLKSVSGFLNAPMGGGIKKMLGFRHGQMVQLYNASKHTGEGNVFDLITRVHKYVDELVAWLTTVSNITDQNKFMVYFGNGENNHGTFKANLIGLFDDVAKINTMVGNTLKNDSVMVHTGSKLIEMFQQVAAIEKIHSDFDGGTSQIYNYYNKVLFEYLSKVLQPNVHLDDSKMVIKNLLVFDKYVCENAYKAIFKAKLNDGDPLITEHCNNLKSMVYKINTVDLSAERNVINFIKENVGTVKPVTDIGTPAEFTKHKEELMNQIFTMNANQSGLKEVYRIMFDQGFKDINDALFLKLRFMNQAVGKKLFKIPDSKLKYDNLTDEFGTLILNIFKNVESFDSEKKAEEDVHMLIMNNMKVDGKYKPIMTT